MSKCYHTGCRCTEATVERSGQNFCSNQCAQEATQGSLAEAMCNCAHSGCDSRAGSS
jgi:hypothetical protein